MSRQTGRRRIVGVSTKMYFTLARTDEYIRSLLQLGSALTTPHLEFFVIPDLLSLPNAGALLSSSPIRLGAQDCFWEDSGAFTGEVSPALLKGLGCSIVELGHAERRRLFGETDEQVALKAKAAERNGMTSLVCVGEKVEGDTAEAVKQCWAQMEPILDATKLEVIWAYEPVWAIGQEKPATAEYVVAVTKQLRKLCEDRGRECRIIYGGSAGPGTFESMSDGLDGLFLGRFAHSVKNVEIVAGEIGGS